MAFSAFSQLNTPGRFSSGNPGVTYDAFGRLQTNTQDTAAASSANAGPAAPRAPFFWRSAAASSEAPAHVVEDVQTRWSFLPWNRGGTPGVSTQGAAVTTSSELATLTPFVNRTRYDNYAPLPGLGYRENLISMPAGLKRQTTTVTQQRVAVPPTTPDSLVIEEMKVYDERPLWWWLFILVGVLLIVLGVLNVLWCIELHYYCRFWTGIMLIIFGILGAIHRGDYYKRTWKTVLYLIVGTLTAVAVYACLTFDLQTFCHKIIEISQFNNNAQYIQEMKFRMSFLTMSPLYVLNNDVGVNIWVCFAMEGLTLILLILSFLVITAMLHVIDRYYNSHFVITRKVEPFCSPSIFNPWGQASLGQAQIFIGAVLNAAVHGNNVFMWQQTFAPLWSGIIPIIAGIFAALSLKSCGLNHRCWNILSIILEFISAIVSIVAIILTIIGMIQNIQTLQQSTVMNYTSFAQSMMLSSTFLFCISVIACLCNVFYSIALLIRLIVCMCCNNNNNDKSTADVQYIYDDSYAVRQPLKATPGGVVNTGYVVRQPLKAAPGGVVNTGYLIDQNQPIAYGREGGASYHSNPFDDQFESPYRIGQDTRLARSLATQ